MENGPERKIYKLTDVKIAEENGKMTAVFATLNVVDHDGDLTLPGAFGRQKVLLSQYNHGSWGKGVAALPVGVGEIYEVGDEARIDAEFNLDSNGGSETYKAIKYLHNKGVNQEFSYALPEVDWEIREIDGREIRVLKRIVVPEVSPVIMGAGLNTRILAMKVQGGMKLIDHLDVVVKAAEELVERLSIVREMRDYKHSDLSHEVVSRIGVLEGHVKLLAEVLNDLSHTRQKLLEREVVRFIKTTGGIM